jgi:hypothetical protein
MKRFAVIAVLLYGAILALLTLPMLLDAFYPSIPFKDLASAYASWRYWVIIVIMMACQAALLGIPVSAAGKRPVSKKPVMFSVIASGFLAAFLVFGIVAAAIETFTEEPVAALSILDMSGGKTTYFGLAGFIIVWLIWGAVFYRWSRKLEPKVFVEKQCRLLFRGSVLELLIAVPTHILARSKDYCCAGFSTFVGIALGISVMIISFGPGIFFLYADRWKKLHPQGK